jgi:phospholipid/cholesterol/gamma-HCH transport system substrate-binding protein
VSTAGVHDPRRSYTLVGAFVLLMLAALVLWIALISGRTGAIDRYTIAWTNVMGLVDGSPVSFQGYRVGRVERIGPTGEGAARGFEVEISVKRGWPIPEDSVARMLSSGLLSALVVDIAGGESQTLLAPGARIESRERDDVFTVVSAAAGQMGELVRSLDPLIRELEEGAPEIVGNVRTLTNTLNETAGRLSGLVSEGNAARVETILSELASASRSAASVASELRQTGEDLDALLTRVDGVVAGNESDLRQLVADLRDSAAAIARGADSLSDNLVTASQNLVEFSDDVRRDPSVLVRGRAAGDEP